MADTSDAQSEAQAAADFPFRPVINADSHRILDLSRYRPIHERVGDLQRTKVCSHCSMCDGGHVVRAG